jgi:hypothetical protein
MMNLLWTLDAMGTEGGAKEELVSFWGAGSKDRLCSE